MEKEELIRLANEGDVEAMLELVRGYIEEDKYGESAEWAERAAEAGSFVGNYLAMQCKGMDVHISAQLTLYETMLEKCKAVQKHAKILLNADQEGIIQLDEEQSSTIHQNLRQSLYSEAYYYYVKDGDGRRAMEIIREPEDTKEAMLFGLCCERANRGKEAFEYLRRAGEDSEYRAKDKSHIEQHVYAVGMSLLSIYYRVELPYTGPADLNAAVNALQNGISGLRNKEMQNIPREELKRYRKKLFGGWKYIKS